MSRQMQWVARLGLAALLAGTIPSLCSGAAVPTAGRRAREILQATGVKGGLIVHVGCGDGKLTAALRANDSYVVQGLDTDARNVAAARQHIRSLRVCGSVSVVRFDGKRLPYIDNLVNLVVCERPDEVAMAEILRVLVPGGVAFVGGKKTVKPWPKTIDEWTHYLHGPDNNAVAHDTVVGPPRHMQWLARPLWTRNHHRLNSVSCVVTTRGRVFYIVDEATAANMSVPGKWSIAARDAFSGVRLWKKRIGSWTWHGVRFRSGPPQVTRLLVASADRLYAPLGLNAPVSMMDAVTGKTLKTYDDTAGAEEIIVAGGILLALRGAPVAEHAAGHPAYRGKHRLPNRKTVVAVNAETGATLWTWSDPQADIMPETLGSDGGKVYFQVNESVTCLDLKSGRERWTFGQRGKRQARKRVTYGRHTLVVADGVVLCKLSGQLTALSAEKGKKLWECKAGGGFHSPLDIFVIDGLVWQGHHVSDSVAPPPVRDFNECRDLRTGEVKATNAVMVDLQTAGHHHRCYREKATDRYIITGKRGIEMMDLRGDNHSRNNWVRGTCQYGILPANGLLYAPAHSCGCYMESMLWGFWALAAERPVVSDPKRRVVEDRRLEKGPAYGKATNPLVTAERAVAGQSAIHNPQSAIHNPQSEWPQYRHDALRSGVAGTAVPAKLKRAWEAKIGRKLTQPVVAGGKVLVAAVDEGAVYALDAESGRKIWDFVSGGRVDSPPAIHKGMVLFGSADGWVYCLRLSDGELAWRFLAARADLRAVALNQVESLWPVHGSVLVLDGVAYCSAGRSTWIDGGIDLYGLAPATGKVVCKARFESRHPKLKEGKDKAKREHVTRVSQNTTDYKTFLAPDRSDSFSMAGGTISDVLVSDGHDVFLHQVRFSAALKKRDEMSRHLFSTSSLLDDAENHRSHWVLGTGDFSRVPVAYSWIVNRPGRRSPTIAVPTGVMMVYTDRAVWGVQRKGGANGKYQLFQKANAPFSDEEKPLPDFRRIPRDQASRSVWKKDLPVRARALLKSGSALFVGAMPVDIPKDDPHAAYEGRRGGMVWVVSAEDGSRLAEYKLESPVAWDGMAAANGRLYLTTMDGKVVCMHDAR